MVAVDLRASSRLQIKVYVNSESGEDKYALPLTNGVADLVFSTSLFTHLLEDQLIDYCRESHRVLKLGGHMAMYCFCLDYPPPTFGDRHTFSHTIGNARVESIVLPEAAVLTARSSFSGSQGKPVFEPQRCWQVGMTCSPCCCAKNKCTLYV